MVSNKMHLAQQIERVRRDGQLKNVPIKGTIGSLMQLQLAKNYGFNIKDKKSAS